MDSVARGTLINLLTRTAAVALVLAITTITARIGTETQGAFALFTSVEGVLLALLSGFGIALARRVSHHREQPAALLALADIHRQQALAGPEVLAGDHATAAGHACRHHRAALEQPQRQWDERQDGEKPEQRQPGRHAWHCWKAAAPT